MRVKNLQKYFPVKKKNFFGVGKDYVKANKDLTIDIYEGETLGIVGESGCGKSTFG
ncbi:ATP-binding cassette domain-containing protein, partial [Enterococcus casseliflavus]